MTILHHMYATNVFRSQSMSVFANFLPARMSSKCASFNSVSPLLRTRLLWIRSFSSDQTEDRFPKSLTSEEKAWEERVTDVTRSLQSFYDAMYLYSVQFLNGDKRLQLFSMKEERSLYRKRWAVHRLVNKIEDVGKRLIDENVDKKCQMFYLSNQFEKWIAHVEGLIKVEIINYDECWLSLIELSDKPLAHTLRAELNAAGIKHVTFAESVSSVYIKLQRKSLKLRFWSLEVVDFGVDDINEILNDSSFNDTEYKCMQILFNLEESEKWQIKDREKVQNPADYL